MSFREWTTVRWEAFGRSSDAYGTVVLLMFALIVLPPFLGVRELLETFVTALLAGGVVVLSLAASAVRPPLVISACVIWVLAVVAAILPSPPEILVNSIGLLLGVLLIGSPVAILSRIGRHQTVTLRTVLGAIAVYLQLGLAFALFYATAYRIDAAAFPALSEVNLTSFVYFSFVTLTTVGYGDIAPATDITRTLAIFEALTGQIFLVVVVARVVGMLGRKTGRGTGADPGP